MLNFVENVLAPLDAERSRVRHLGLFFPLRKPAQDGKSEGEEGEDKEGKTQTNLKVELPVSLACLHPFPAEAEKTKNCRRSLAPEK